MIEFRQVTKRYDSDHTALRQVNFGLERGELAFLTGHSGAGKSTLLKLIMVMERPSAGEVIVGGQVLNTLPRRQVPYIRRHIGVVFQNHQLLFDRTVFDNVAMPLEVMGTPARDIGRRVRAALDKVGLLSKEKMNPMQLSGGEQQRVGIARAVVNKPPVLLADEPTGNLDPELSADIMRLFAEFSQVGVTVLIATHDIALINDLGRRTLTLDHGRLVTGVGAKGGFMANDPRRQPARGAKSARSPWRQQAESYLNHHRKVARDSAQRLWHSPVASMMTWTVMGVALALPVALMLLLASLEGVSAGWESSARVTAYLSDAVSIEDARSLKAEVADDSRVAEVELIDRETALEEFRASSGLEDALDYLDGNPLPHTLLVTPSEGSRTADGVEMLLKVIEGLDGVDRVQVDLGWLQRLNAMTDLLGRAVWALALLLAAAVVLVIGNTVRLAIENRRDEILVAKLVGGTDAFVRRPFLYTGAWFGLGGGIVAFILLQVSLWWLSGPVERLAGLYRSEFSLSGLSVDGALALIIAAMLLGWLGAWVAVKRHLDDIEPGEIAGG